MAAGVQPGVPAEVLADHLLLRRPRLADAAQLAAVVQASRAELSAWMDWAVPGYGLQEAQEFIGLVDRGWPQEHVSYLIWRDGELVGCCGLNHFRGDHDFANLGYWTATAWAGQGIASQATRAVAQLGFHHLGLARVDIVACVGNRASQRAAEKAGATREGVLRRRLKLRGEMQDAVMYSLVPADLAGCPGHCIA